MSIAKHTSMSHVAGYRAANFITMGSPAYNEPRKLFKRVQLHQQAQLPSQLKKKHHRQHPKQTYCPTQHNLIHRPQQSLVPSDPWKLIDQELEFKIYDIYKNVVYLKPRFMAISKNKPGLQFIESLNQRLMSLVEEASISNVAMKAAMILHHLVLPKTKSEKNGSNSKNLSRPVDEL